LSQAKLSICIPTYNFGAFIAQTLDSIVGQLAPGVEVVILDGGSTDNTSEVVRSFLDRGLPINYVRQEVRGGIDRDMVRTVDLARGEYCWLFSSDDIMKPGAIRIVLEEIQSGHDIYLCGLTLCDVDMNVISEHPVGRASGVRSEDRCRPTPLFQACRNDHVIQLHGLADLQARAAPTPERAYIDSLWAHVVHAG
jgi:glycosyltransferase involved in cell wall biosynthesis